jgi:hypothetical protein
VKKIFVTNHTNCYELLRIDRNEPSKLICLGSFFAVGVGQGCAGGQGLAGRHGSHLRGLQRLVDGS